MKNLISLMLVGLMSLANATTHAEDTRCYELRTYHANEGKLDALHARFRDHTVKLFEKHGMTNVGYFVPKDNSGNVLIYVLAFPDKAARAQAWKDFLADADWKAAYKASIADGKLVGKIDSVIMKATDYTPAIKASKNETERLFELRTYTTLESRLPALNARFRDHTSTLFAKHGLEQVAYWTPADEKDGKDTKLIYILAHKDEETRGANFKAFGQDPKWQAARKESVADGPILVKKGVKSVLLKPTDYSPTR